MLRKAKNLRMLPIVSATFNKERASVEEQLLAISKLCADRKWVMLKPCPYQYRSLSEERPDIEEALEACRTDQADGIIGADLYFLCGSIKDLVRTLSSLREAGKHFVVCNQPIFDTVEYGQTVLDAMKMYVEWKRLDYSTRACDTLRISRSQGRLCGGIPYGMKMVKRGKRKGLKPDPEEQKIITLMRELYAAGTSLRGIAAELNKRNVPTKAGKQWQANQVKRILARMPSSPSS